MPAEAAGNPSITLSTTIGIDGTSPELMTSTPISAKAATAALLAGPDERIFTTSENLPDLISLSSVSTKAPIGMPRKSTMPLDLTV